MEKVKKRSAIAALCGILAVSGGLTVMKQREEEPTTTVQVYETEAQEKDYTVMVYMIGSDLESDADGAVGAGSADLMEMMEALGGDNGARISEKMNLVVEIGGSEQWSMPELQGITNARFCIDASGIAEMEELVRIDMGEKEALSDFINYASGNYPAENYILILWDHGNGPVGGYGYDMLYDGDSLTLKELDRGIAESEISHFELIGFDACLMGNMETVHVVSPYADYMAGSADLEAGDGWDYSWLEIFAEEPQDTVGIATRIVDCYYEFYAESKGCATLSCYDLKAYSDVRQEMEYYNAQVLEDADTQLYELVSRARTQAQGFGDRRAALDSLDLVDFAGFYRSLSPEAWENAALEETLDTMIVATKSVGYADEICGISIYVPSGSDMMLEEDIAKYQECLFLDSYLGFAKGYADYLLNGESPEIEEAAAAYGEEIGKFTMTLDAEAVDRIVAAYLITAVPIPELSGCSSLLTTDSDLVMKADGSMEAEPDSEYIGLMGEPLCLIEQYNSEECTDYLSPLLYNGELCLAKIQFSEENPDGEILSIVPMSDGTTSAKREYRLETGVTVMPLYPLVTDSDMDVSSLETEEKVYEGAYYIGNACQIEEEYDALLETIVIAPEDCLFGFMLQDTRQQLLFTELLPLPEETEEAVEEGVIISI
ncbi:MAG: clostripain-related cysteine peptidase [Roseburia sp.]|nr:clostripain-related cysteine peptidase [Roseburia sp.]